LLRLIEVELFLGVSFVNTTLPSVDKTSIFSNILLSSDSMVMIPVEGLG